VDGAAAELSEILFSAAKSSLNKVYTKIPVLLWDKQFLTRISYLLETFQD
jgi:hypothetical protein